MAASEQHFRLADGPGSLGLNCQSSGVSLAGVPLLRKTSRGFAPRTADEIGALMKCAYGQETDAIRLTRGLDVVADALNCGDLGRAMIAAVHLRLGDGESPHARESVIEALRLAGEKEFSTVLFNSTLSTIARYVEPPNEVAVESVRRPDVAAITRPSLDRPDRIVPYEILSGRQTIQGRRGELPNVPGIRLVDGRKYEKRFDRYSPAWFERLGVRRLCM